MLLFVAVELHMASLPTASRMQFALSPEGENGLVLHFIRQHLLLAVVEDWTSAANSINGWLKYFLWTEAAQVIRQDSTWHLGFVSCLNEGKSVHFRISQFSAFGDEQK